MKKNRYELCGLDCRIKKMLFVMKFTIAAFFMGLMSLSAASTYSQNTKISLNIENATLIDVFKQIEAQSEFVFIYKNETINLDKKVDVKIEGATVDKILEKVLNNSDVKFEINNKQIIITPNREIPSNKNEKLIKEEIQQPQKKAISGTVKDSKGISLPGVSVVVKGTTTGITTDSNGKFTLAVPTEAKAIIFSFVGMKAQEFAITGKTSFNVVMEEETVGLEEVVAIGYGTKKKVSLTTAVATIEGEELALNNRSDVRQIMQGMTPGLTIQDFGGSPGQENLRVRIRGISSLNNTDPLILIDGVESWINSVNPNEIESVSVLKDAASTAIYGSRGANGVILITTKRGKDGTFNVKYDMYYGLQNQAVVPKFATSENYMRAINTANQSVGSNPAWTEENILAYKEGEKNYPDLYPTAYTPPSELTEWSPITNHSLLISGGSKKISSLFSASYQSNEGYYKTKNDEKRYLARLNTDFRPNDKISASANFVMQKIDLQTANIDYFRATYFPYDFFSGILPGGTYLPGLSNGSVMTVLDVDQNGYVDNNNFNYSANIGGKIDIIDGLSLQSNLSVLMNDWNSDRMVPKYEFYDFWNEDLLLGRRSKNQLSRSASNDIHTTLTSILSYKRTIGIHNFSALLGYSEDEYKMESTYAQGSNLYNNDLRSLNQSEVETRYIDSNIQEWGLRSFFSRMSYDFKEKYLLDISARYDGSSRFPKGNKYTFFPAASAAWNIHKENFWEPVSHIVNSLKLRASLGVNGSQNIGNYEYIDQLSLGNNYMFNGSIVNTARYNTLASKELSWERTKQYNLGLDASFLENKLVFSFDTYNKLTDGILLRLPIAGVVGLDPARSNVGAVSNKGWELELSWKGNVRDFKYNISVNGSFNKDILTDFGGLPDQKWDWQGQSFRGKGFPLFSTRGLIHEGFYNSQEEIDNGPEVFTRSNDLVPGDPKFKDVSGPDGKPDGKITDDDMVFLGSAVPKYNYGLKFNADYKNFFFSMFWQGAADFKRILTHPFGAPMNWNDHVMLQVEADNYWRPDNHDALWPAPHAGAFQGIWPSSRTIRDASFVCLKNLTLGYSFSDNFINKIGLNKLDVFVTGTNPLIISKFANFYGMEPEGSYESDYRSTYYFQSKSWRVGLSLEF